MIKPQKLRKGDKVAIVSLSSGMLGDEKFLYKFVLGKERLEKLFGLEVVAMENTLKGSEYIFNNPQARAKDLMDAFKDKSIKAIICAIGGEETYRLLPYIDYEVIKNNPKIFMGFSDTTTNHLMMYKAGLVSFYGPCLMCDFAEHVKMHDYTVKSIKDILFNDFDNYEIVPSDEYAIEYSRWGEENKDMPNTYVKDDDGYEVLQGQGKVKGNLLGGCLESLSSMLGYFDPEWYDGETALAENTKKMVDEYDLFPKKEEWKDKILFLETSEVLPTPEYLEKMLNTLVEFGIIEQISGIIVGKPKQKKYYEEYKEVYKKVIGSIRNDLPILYNINFGHANPLTIIPYSIEAEIDCDNKKLTLLENCVK